MSKNEAVKGTGIRITTEKLAARFGVKSGTVRESLCRRGHYQNLTPLKLPTGRLLWPDVHPEDVIASDPGVTGSPHKLERRK